MPLKVITVPSNFCLDLLPHGLPVVSGFDVLSAGIENTCSGGLGCGTDTIAIHIFHTFSVQLLHKLRRLFLQYFGQPEAR